MIHLKNIILYVGKFELPHGTAAAQRVNVNKKILESLNYDVRFISTFESEESIKKYKEHVNINNISEKKFLYDISYIKNIVQEIGVENIHSIIFYNYPSLALLRAGNYLRKEGIKVISDCTEWYSIPQKAPILRKFIKTLDTELRMRYVHKKIDGVICISTYLQKYYNECGVNTVLIPNVLDLSDRKWDKLESKLDITKIKFIYAGNPGKDFEKENLDLIVQVFNKLTLNFSNIELKIIGVNSDYFTDIYINRYKRKPNLNKISFEGRKNHLEVIEKVKESDYFIFFRPKSKANLAGFPTKLVEAFGSLTPVITNNIGDVSLYINNGINGFVLNTNDLSQLEKEISSILKNHNTSKTLKRELKNNNPFDYRNFINNFGEFIK